MYKNVYLRKGKEESLLRFHPWIFSGAISHSDNDVQDGEIVRVVTAGGNFIAVGHFQMGSIAVRVLSFEDEEINHDFWKNRLAAALRMRVVAGIASNPNNNTFRLVHGEGDNLPGLVVDCYGSTAVMQAHSVGMHLCRHEVAKALVEVMGQQLTSVYYKSETTLPFLEQQTSGFIVGNDENDVALENVRGGAQLVHSVDSSAKAIELTNRNVERNFPGDKRHQAFCDDAFSFLQKTDCEYDLIILDPPAFAKHRGALHNALKGYTRLNAKAFEIIQPGGILFTFSCSQVVTKDHFRNAVFTAAAQAKRKVRILHQLHQPADHPINIYHPEGEYLKGLVLYVE